jgi:hypothetical protein
MSKPLLFISHKHDDREIANTVARFVRDITGGQVKVFVSSNPEFEGPRVGKELNKELKKALWNAGVVILIYTSDDKDWSWCMWECGLAEDPESPDTKVVVLQCLRDKPKVFQSGLNVLAWHKDSLITLAYRFRDADFFPGRDGPVTGLKDTELRDRAEQLYEDLHDVIPVTPTENWSAWPFLRLKLSRELVDKLSLANNQSPEARHKVLGDALVTVCSSGLPQLFGRAEVAANTPFAELIQEWTCTYPERTRDWLDVISRQILAAAKKRRPRIDKWDHFREVEGDSEFAPCVGRIKSDQFEMHFDCYFFGLAEVPLVSSRMVRRNQMYHIDLFNKAAEELVLRDLLHELEESQWNRIPILDHSKAKYIIHVSMINRFISKRAYLGKPVENLTLEDLLGEKEMEEFFARTFEVVSEGATLDDARRAMIKKENCLDIFVTKGGGRDEAVEGWLTDRELI